ncbi:MAG: hypothetical protein M3P11_07715 [Actinomycetota bacterium]|nr:hypothetical protein [Actinomycetota bacterium]
MDLSFAQERLAKEFAGIFSAEIVGECLEGSARVLRHRARITSYIPMLAERIARDHLRATQRRAAA